MSLRVLGALLCGSLQLLATTAHAIQGDPLPGIDVSMEQSPGGIIIAATTTDNDGQLSKTIELARGGNYRLLARLPAPPASRPGTAEVTLTISSAGKPQTVLRFTASWEGATTIGIPFTTTAAAVVKGAFKEGRPENPPGGTARACLWAGAAYSLGAAFCTGPDTAIECLKPPEWVAKKYEPCASAAPLVPR